MGMPITKPIGISTSADSLAGAEREKGYELTLVYGEVLSAAIQNVGDRYSPAEETAF